MLPSAAPLDRACRLALAGLTGAAALLRTGWALVAAVRPTELADPGFYFMLGESLADGGGYAYPFGPNAGPTAYYPPGYPGFLGGLFWLADRLPFEVSRFGVAVAANVVLSVLLVPLVFAMGRRLVGPRAGLVAAGVVALYPNLVFHSAVVLTETLFLVLLVVLLLMALPTPELARDPGPWRIMVLGVLVGLTVLVRPVSVALLPAFLVVWWPRGGWTAMRRAGLLAAATLLVVMPWTIRNLVVMDTPVLLSTNFGDNLCIGNHDGAPGTFAQPDECLAGYEDLRRPDYETTRNADNLRRARDFVRSDPLQALDLIPRRAFETFSGDHDGLDAAVDYGARPFLASTTHDLLAFGADALFFAFLALGVAGLALALRRPDANHGERDRRQMLLVAVVLLQLLPPLVTFGDTRFKAPTYPMLALWAGLALTCLWDRWSGGRPEPTARTPSASDAPASNRDDAEACTTRQ